MSGTAQGPVACWGQFFQQTANRLDYVQILTLVVPADVICFTHGPGGRYAIQRAGMILHVQPVADLLPVAVYRQRFARQRVKNRQWDQLFREVVRAVVVGAVGNQRR